MPPAPLAGPLACQTRPIPPAAPAAVWHVVGGSLVFPALLAPVGVAAVAQHNTQHHLALVHRKVRHGTEPARTLMRVNIPVGASRCTRIQYAQGRAHASSAPWAASSGWPLPWPPRHCPGERTRRGTPAAMESPKYCHSGWVQLKSRLPKSPHSGNSDGAGLLCSAIAAKIHMCSCLNSS